MFIYQYGGGGATRPLPRDGGVEELHEDQQSGHATRSGPEVKNGKSSAKDDTPERLRCGAIQERVSQVQQEKIFLSYLHR